MIGATISLTVCLVAPGGSPSSVPETTAATATEESAPSATDAPAASTDHGGPSPASNALIAAPKVVVLARFGTMTSRGTAGSTLIAPAVGVGLERWFTRTVGLAARYDFATSTRGTSDASVTRVGQQLAVTADARFSVHPAASLQVGLGAGAAWLLATSAVGGDSRTASSLEPGVAWLGSFDIAIVPTRFGTTLGASGFVHRASHDIFYFAGLELTLD